MAIDEYFHHYDLWQTNKNLYHKRSYNDIDWFREVPRFYFKNVTAINSCTNKLILIDALGEGYHHAPTFNKYNDDKTYVIFCSDTWPHQATNITLSNYHLVYWPNFFLEISDTWHGENHFSFYTEKLYDFDVDKKFIFMTTIGNWKEPRWILVNKLLEKINYQNFVIRFNGKDYAQASDHLDILEPGKSWDSYTTLIDVGHHSASSSIPIKLYNSAWVNLCVETRFDLEDNWLVSEKTAKTIISGMPFISVATPNFLKGLRDIGFKTYNELWDESYDNIVKWQDRVAAIIDLLNSLENFDWQKNKQKLLSIAQHNARNMLNCNKWADKSFDDFEKVVELCKQM